MAILDKKSKLKNQAIHDIPISLHAKFQGNQTDNPSGRKTVTDRQKHRNTDRNTYFYKDFIKIDIMYI